VKENPIPVIGLIALATIIVIGATTFLAFYLGKRIRTSGN